MISHFFTAPFSFAQADIDHVLRLGGNTYRQRERIVAAFEEQKSTTEIADTLKTLYHGGNGIGRHHCMVCRGWNPSFPRQNCPLR